MKRSLLLIFCALCLYTLTNAQTADSAGPQYQTQQPQGQKQTAAKRAAQQLKKLEKQLHLTEDQVLQLQVILINRDVAIDSVARRHSVGPSTPPGPGRTSDFRKNDNRTRKDINQDADQKINALLTDEQKPLYQQWKEQQQEKARTRRQQAVNNTNP